MQAPCGLALRLSRRFASSLGSSAASGAHRGLSLAVAPWQPAVALHWGPACQDARGIAAVKRVRINRFTGQLAVKVSAPKTEWQIAAEKEFLALRSRFPKDEYLHHLTADDVRHLSPEMQKCLTLSCGSEDDISRWRKHQLIRQFQRRPFDTNSPAVRIAVLTEKILRVRAHLLRNPMGNGHVGAKRALSIYLARRQRSMKTLYKSDFTLYKHVCQELGIRCVRFAIPPPRDPQKMNNPQAVDGDRARFLIRQRMYHAKFRPRELREPETNRLIRYTRHPLEPPPESHGKPVPVAQQVSRAWPYAVRGERVAGKHVVYNPTAPGRGFWPAKGSVVGGRVREDK